MAAYHLTVAASSLLIAVTRMILVTGCTIVGVVQTVSEAGCDQCGTQVGGIIKAAVTVSVIVAAVIAVVRVALVVMAMMTARVMFH